MRGEIQSLSEHLDTRTAEMRRMASAVESYKLSNEELNVGAVSFSPLHELTRRPQRALTTIANGADDGETFAKSARDFERTRKAYEIQFSEFDIIKKSLMKDLQNRCEKVSHVARSSFQPQLSILCSGRRAGNAAR